MSDKKWRAFLPSMENYASWLKDQGSLTRRIQARCRTFEVRNTRNERNFPLPDERPILNLDRHQRVYTREVFLFADGKPVVFAHSVVAIDHLCGAWSPIQHLGDRPLGAMLFAHPLIERARLSFRKLDDRNELFRRASLGMPHFQGKLWARRSVFQLCGAPLLVTEIFLPGILELPR